MAARSRSAVLAAYHPRPTVRHLAGASAATRRVAGARRHPQVVGAQPTAPPWLRMAAGWSWRALIVLAAIGVVFWATSRVQLVFIAVFLGLVFAAVLRPVADVYSKVMPRALATGLAWLTALLAVGGMLTYVGVSVAGQWNSLADQFNQGINQILAWVDTTHLPLGVTKSDVLGSVASAQEWLTSNSGAIASTAFASAGSVAELFAAVALGVFCSVFFISRGTQLWSWFLDQLPVRMRQRWDVAGGAAWHTFSGYTRGTFLVAASDAVLALIVLVILQVPLAAPLAVLVFIGAFIPLIGAPLAMVIAMVVALAANGLLSALLVGVFVALIGQFEGHVLQPLVMSKQVSLHPLVVAISVTSGTLIAGILGAIIAVPLVAVAWVVFSRLRTADPTTQALEAAADEAHNGRDAHGAQIDAGEVDVDA